MSDHKPMHRNVALAVASEVLYLIGEQIERSTVAGSLRRGLEAVHDVEIVCVAKSHDLQPGLFGDAGGARVSELDQRVAELIDSGIFKPRIAKDGKQAVGPRYKRLWYQHYPVDIFSPLAESFGAQLAIRTGPREFSHLCVTKRADGGAMPFGMRQENGSLWRGTQVIPTPEEWTPPDHPADAPICWFNQLGLQRFIPPEERSAERLRSELRGQQ